MEFRIGVHLGEASAIVAQVLEVNPDLRVEQLECLRGPAPDELPVFQANLRRAGLP